MSNSGLARVAAGPDVVTPEEAPAHPVASEYASGGDAAGPAFPPAETLASVGAPEPDDNTALVLELPLGGIRCWEQTMLLLVSIKAHPKVTMKTTGKLIKALASYADWTSGGDIRPGWKRLMRDVGCSRRSIAYHLGFLREMGALVRVYHGTHLLGGTTMASVYAARIPDTALHRAARDQARAALHKAARARHIPAVGARHVTCPAKAIRSTRGRAAAKRTVARPAVKRNVTHVPHENCTPPGVDLETNNLLEQPGTPGATESKNAPKTAGARDLAEWLVGSVAQFKTAPTGLVENLLKPLAAAGWTRDDLACWLGLRPVPAWYVAATTGLRGLDPWPLPAPERVERPFGLLAHRCSGLAWRGWEPIAAVRRRAHARAVQRNAELLTDADRQLGQTLADAPPQPAPELPEHTYVRVPAPRRGVPQPRAFIPETAPAERPQARAENQPAAAPAWLEEAMRAATTLGKTTTTQSASTAGIDANVDAAAEKLAARADRWRAEGRLGAAADK
jgi:hypothetical protein